jgi:O-antigen/teichoic acid export membrane protein
MRNDISNKDVVWGFVAQGLNIGAGILLLPVLIVFLPPEEVSLWLIFVTLTSLGQVLEFGFQPTIVRNVAYLYSGSQSLIQTGLPDNSHDSVRCINLNLLAELLVTSRFIYSCIFLVAATFIMFGGLLYVNSILTFSQDRSASLLAWALYCSGQLLNFLFGYYNAFLQGRGQVTQSNKIIAVHRGAFLIGSIFVIVQGYGLLGVGVVGVSSAIMGRVVAKIYFDRDNDIPHKRIFEAGKIIKNNLLIIWHNTFRLGIVQVAGFLALRGNILLATTYLGLVEASDYSLTVTLLLALNAISIVISQVHMPKLSALQYSRDLHYLRKVMAKIVIFSVIIYLFGSVFVIFILPSIIKLAEFNISLLTYPYLHILIAIYFLELMHSIASTYLTTQNNIPFFKASIFTGVGVVFLSFVLLPYFGIAALLISQGVTQLCYNNWKWPLEMLKNLNLRLIPFAKLCSEELWLMVRVKKNHG